jgi:hypothetical protein
MNFQRLTILAGLRYRLLWASMRTRGGKVALFVAGYLFAVFVIILLAMGGFGAGIAALHAGQAELVSRIVLGGFFVTVLGSSVALGAGMNAKFSDAALLRYPLTAFERLLARQLLAFLEPVWMIALAFNVAFAFGLCVAGDANLSVALSAALLLTLANFLLARLILTAIARVMVMRGGALALLVAFLAVSLAPALLAHWMEKNQGLAASLLGMVRFTPPLAGAAAMANSSFAALAQLAVGCIALTVGIALFERLPEAAKTVAGAVATWDGPCDRIGAIFGPEQGPLVSKTLRYYLRNTRVRLNLLTSGPVLAVVFLIQPAPHGPESRFLLALSFILVAGFTAAFSMSVNVFGYDASGFRRYLLLPVSPVKVMRAAMIVPLGLGCLPIIFLLAAWMVFAPLHTDGRMLVMLLSNGVGGLLLLTSLGTWTTLLSPRKTEFASNFGNNMSLGGNILVIGSFTVLAGSSALLLKLGRFDRVIAWWWAAPLFVLFGAAVLWLTLGAAPRVFEARREKLLAVLEGKR